MRAELKSAATAGAKHSGAQKRLFYGSQHSTSSFHLEGYEVRRIAGEAQWIRKRFRSLFAIDFVHSGELRQAKLEQ